MSEDVTVSQVEEFAIIFDNDPAVYREGDGVAGTLLIHNTDSVRYGAIFIELCGIALVQWSVPLPGDEANGDIIDPNDVKQGGDYNREQYFHKKIVLSEKDGGFLEHDPILEAGQHTYRFSTKLPPELPSSFEGAYGQVRYIARAVIERSWPRSNVVTKRAFTVLSGLDLNFIPEAAARIEFCKYRTVGSTCCAAGAVTADLTVPRAGYVPGEDIALHGAVQNECRDAVTLSRVALFMIVEYRARKKRRREKREVVKMEKGVTLPDDTTVWSDTLHIPPLPPTGLSRCRLIDIKYELQFYALIDGGHSPIEFTKEVYIGTVPMCRQEMQSCIAGLYNQPYYGNFGSGGGGIQENVFAGTRASQMSLAAIVSVGGAARPAANPTAPPGILADEPDPRDDDEQKPMIEDDEEIIISGVGLSPTKQKNEEILVRSSPPPVSVSSINFNPDPVSSTTPAANSTPSAPRSTIEEWERPPPYAPSHMDSSSNGTQSTPLLPAEYARPEAVNPEVLGCPGTGGGSSGGGGGSAGGGGEAGGDAGNKSHHGSATLAPTPTFEASVFGAVSLREKADDGVSLRGDLTYNPMYTYYETVAKSPPASPATQ